MANLMDQQINLSLRELRGLFYIIRSMRYVRDDIYILEGFDETQIDFLQKLGIKCLIDLKNRPPVARLDFKSFLGGRTF